MDPRRVAARADDLLACWFGRLDDDTPLVRGEEPFDTHLARWYGKRPEIDAELRGRFEADLLGFPGEAGWDAALRAWSDHPRGLLALTLLLDQIPRNIHRGTARMYGWDAPALVVSELARLSPSSRAFTLVEQMFLWVPLMHAENLLLQERMLAGFQSLLARAVERSPRNVPFFRFALQSAQEHRDVIETFGRFPHRNELLGRTSSARELEHLRIAPGF